MFAVLRVRATSLKAQFLVPRPSVPINYPCQAPTAFKALIVHRRSFAMKDESTVIQEFNELVNMSADELTEWLKSDASTGAGWKKTDGSGETVGHDSGRHIVDILHKNPQKDPNGYDEDDIPHMRKVVSYCKRHLAQEETAKRNTDSRSYKSLKNWGHDACRE